MNHPAFKIGNAAFFLAVVTSIATANEGSQYNVSTFSPKSGPAGTTVSIDGTGIGTYTTSVTLNGLPVNFTKTQVYEIKVVIPSNATTGTLVCNGVYNGNTVTASTPGSFVVSMPGTPTTNSGIIPPPPHVPRPANVLTCHPRLWVKPSDIPRLQGWAVPSNPIWLDLQQVANLRKSQMNNGIVPQQDSGDGEGNAYPYATEEIAELFAFMSLVDPSATNRADWAQRSHDLIMYAMNQAVLGVAAGQKFRTPKFSTFNRSRWFGEAWPLAIDWCYGKYSAKEKETIRQVFIRWIHEILDPNTSGGSYTLTNGNMTNNPSMVSNHGALRWTGNNYWANHARNVAMLSMVLDDGDDVPSSPTDYPANYLNDYIGNAIGSWMYVRSYAENHDLAGAISPEGLGYGESSLSGISMLLLTMHSTGYDQTTAYGPAASMGQSSFWQTDATNAYIHSLSPTTTKLYAWQAPMYLPAGFGDVNNFDTVDMIREFGPLAVMDISDGNLNSKRLNDIRWIETWLSPGGPSQLDQRLTSSLYNYGTLLPILYFMTFDPSATPPSDPRVNTPTSYFAPGLNRMLERTDWGLSASWFSFISGFNTVDHQWGDSNSFSFYRKGEFITKEWSGYGNNIGSTPFQNNLSIQNPPLSATAQGYILDQASHGSQYSYSCDGDPAVLTSRGTDYAFADGDVTKRFNASSLQASDVQLASRSILWLKPDTIFIYDRADSKSAGKYKRTYLNFAQSPTVTNNKFATLNTPGGQSIRVDCLLPNSSTTSIHTDMPSTTWSYNESTPEEPMHYRLITEDTNNPQSCRFLNVLQAADAGTNLGGAASIPSSGSPYNGAFLKGTAVFFAKTPGQTFSGLQYSVPSITTSHFVTGLVPGAGYKVAKSILGVSLSVTITTGGTTVADAAGMHHFN